MFSLGSRALFATSSLSLEAACCVETPRSEGLFSDIVVYTRSVLVEQTTPVGVEISDTSSDVQNATWLRLSEATARKSLPPRRRIERRSQVTFTDLDLDLGDVGGHVYWETPLESSQARQHCRPEILQR